MPNQKSLGEMLLDDRMQYASPDPEMQPAVPGYSDPLAAHFGRDRIGHNVLGALQGATGVAGLVPTVLDPNPLTKTLLGLTSAAMLGSAGADFAQAGRARDAQRMWANTGLPSYLPPKEQE